MGVIISVAGPFAQFVSGLCILLVEKAYIIEHPVYQYLIGIYIYISIYWALLNLLPIYPLDGSKIVMGVLNLSMGKIIHIISIIFSLLGMLTLFLLFGDSISFLFIYLLLHNLQAIQMDSRF
jgi:Zn-dependent protease